MASCFNAPDFITARKRDLSITPPSGSIIIQSSESKRPMASASFRIIASPNLLSSSRIASCAARSVSELIMYIVYLNAEQTYLFRRLTRIDSGQSFLFRDPRERCVLSRAVVSTLFGDFRLVRLAFQGELPKDKFRACEALRCASKGHQRVSFAGPPH